MPDKVEEILKQIHILFAKSDTYHNDTDMVVVSKQEMFNLLEELNEAIYEVMDQYEVTTRARERARLEMDREAAEIAANAKQQSDDIHAASLCYTDTMLGDVREIIETARKNVKHELLEMLAQLESSEEQIDVNREGLKTELSEMYDANLYVDYIEKLRKNNEEKKSSKGENEEEEDIFKEPEPQKPNLVIRIDKPGDNAGITISSRKNRKNKPQTREEEAEAVTGEEEVPVPKGTVFSADDFNLDAEYEQWKANGGDEGEGKNEEAPAKKKSGFAALFGKK